MYRQTKLHVFVPSRQLILHHETHLQPLGSTRVQRTEVVSYRSHHNHNFRHEPASHITYPVTEDCVAADKTSSRQENLYCKAIVSERRLRTLEMRIIQAKVLAVPARIAVGSPEEVCKGIGISTNKINEPVPATVVAGVAAPVAAASWVADQ